MSEVLTAFEIQGEYFSPRIHPNMADTNERMQELNTAEAVANETALVVVPIDLALEAGVLKDELEATHLLLQQILHQLSTDSDLDDQVSAPEKYDALEQAIRAALPREYVPLPLNSARVEKGA